MFYVIWIDGPQTPVESPTVGRFLTYTAAHTYAQACAAAGETVMISPTRLPPWGEVAVAAAR